MTAAIAIFDIGKTNKKLLLFDEHYQLLDEQTTQLDLIRDEDGDFCEDIAQLSNWVRDVVGQIIHSRSFALKAINVAAYGASFVHLDQHGKVLTPLYDYLKPYPSNLADDLYHNYGGKDVFSLTTSSPALGSLNSGLQLLRLKKLQNNTYTQVHYSLHLPQYLSWLISGRAVADITSVGCHTGMWDFPRRKYHRWLTEEGISEKLPEILPSDNVTAIKLQNRDLLVGIGLHDSSAALVPYLSQFSTPFLLLSTGTWNISLNPFNESSLTLDQLQNDCLCYLDFENRPVKASRLFAGHEHEEFVLQLSDHFQTKKDKYKSVVFDPEMISYPVGRKNNFEDLTVYKTYEEAYHSFMTDLVSRQSTSTSRVLEGGPPITQIFVDGGFCGNSVFMNLLSRSFPRMEVSAAPVPHATALGAALAIHSRWNKVSKPPELIRLVRFG